MALHFLLFLLNSLSCLPLVNGCLTLFLKFCRLYYLLCRVMDPIPGRPHSPGLASLLRFQVSRPFWRDCPTPRGILSMGKRRSVLLSHDFWRLYSLIRSVLLAGFPGGTIASSGAPRSPWFRGGTIASSGAPRSPGFQGGTIASSGAPCSLEFR